MAEIRLRYIKAWTDQHGKPRYYFRRKGYPSVPLPAPGSPGFMAAYEAANKLPAAPVIHARVSFIPGSLGWAIEQFLSSDEYKVRAANTQRQDRHLFDELRATFGAGLLRDLSDRHVKKIRDYFRDKFTASSADVAISRLSVVWQYADQHLDIDDLGANPTVGIARVHKRKSKREPLPDDVLAAFNAHAPGHLRLAVMLLLYTGQRRSDVVKMKWSHFDGDTIDVVQQKTGEPLTIPCHKRLRAVLSTLPRRSEFILTGERGQPYKAASLAKLIKRQLKAIGIDGYSVHGLRSNAAQALAEAGCSISEIMAILGHRSPAMALHYAKRADKKRLARSAIDRWENDGKVSNLRTKQG
jgi:enterobacteria phage integrase